MIYRRVTASVWFSRNTKSTKFSCEYQPIIEALERGEKLTEKHPAVQQFIKDCKEKYNAEPYLGGLEDLTIQEIADSEQYIVEEYNGSESLRLRNSEDWN